MICLVISKALITNWAGWVFMPILETSLIICGQVKNKNFSLCTDMMIHFRVFAVLPYKKVAFTLDKPFLALEVSLQALTTATFDVS